MKDFLSALALVFVIEGMLYAAFPEGMKAMMARALTLPPSALRMGGLIAAAFGVALLWLVRG